VSVCVLVALTQLLASATTEHVVYSGKTQEGGGEGVCPGDQQTRTVLNEMDMEVRGVARDIIVPRLVEGLRPSRPANSCNEISELHPGLSSGYYWVRSHNGTAVQVYCDMDRVCGCNSTGGFTRVANLNMSNPAQVNGSYKPTAQNQGGYVEGAAVVEDASQLCTTRTESATATCAGE